MKQLRVRPECDTAQVERGPAFTFTFEGQSISAHQGETIGAALMAAGILTFRTTRLQGRPRGLFCGIGLCFDCLVAVNGIPNQQACLVAVKPDMRVQAQIGTGEDTNGN
jgi:predicted molibdopterin-dependent oxidoreductase YjgC